MQEISLPDFHNYAAWWQLNSRELLAAYTQGERDFVPGLLPEYAVKMDGVTLAETLGQRFGYAFLTALDPEQQTRVKGWSPPNNGDWLKRSHTVGVNVRTVGNFYNVVKYALTLPLSVDCIHLLPIWEPGVVSSLYGIASWQINPAFFSREMVMQFPQLNTVEKQLHACVNLLHLMGKKVGMEVIPHTDRYSEIVLANPNYFEWLRRDGMQIIDHHAQLSNQVAVAIFSWLQLKGAAVASPPEDITLLNSVAFFDNCSEAERLLMLFGQPHDYAGRQARRIQLVDHLYRLGLEPVPATMAPPYRGLEVDPDPAASTVDEAGRIWQDYRIINPQEMSRVFGPLTRFQLYERLADNAHWEIDFDRPKVAVWDYVQTKYAEVQAKYGFDFMRGDMSHVQMRPAGVPKQAVAYYDLLAAVKQHIQLNRPSFAYFAESFLTPPNYMAYGDEVDHLEASAAEVTLGNLQSMVPGEKEFLSNFRYYTDLAVQRKVVPAFAVITGDKDDPRFDKYYLWANEARLFTALFLPILPGYFSLGYRQRNIHPYPAPNEHYTKLFVFQLQAGAKATHGPYVWGENYHFFHRSSRLFAMADHLKEAIDDAAFSWVSPPDPTASQPYCCWSLQSAERQYLFVVNFSNTSLHSVGINQLENISFEPLFSTHERVISLQEDSSNNRLVINQLSAGEGIILKA